MLAIVIPFYKIDFFEETLRSLANQTNKNFTVYIGDDASSHSPLSLIELYKSSISIEYTRFEDNLGGKNLVGQWDRCMQLIPQDTEWFAILGDDDFVDPNYVESFYSHLSEINQFSSNVIRFAVQKVNHETKDEVVFFNQKTQTNVDFILNKTRSSLSEYVFKHALYKEIGFRAFDLAWGSDVLAVFEWAKDAPIYSINTSKVYVRISAVSISGTVGSVKVYRQKTSAIIKMYYHILKNYSYLFTRAEKKKMFRVSLKNYRWDKKNIIKLYYLSKIFFLTYK